ncbi:MAG: ArsA-related P-loop ATPase, partial [bacterium]
KADVGIALDGDADRVIMIDKKGSYINGDHIMAICATEMKNKDKLSKSTIVATTMSNLGFELAMKKKGIKVIRTDVGDRYVVDEMRKNNYNFGGEQSGHIIFFDYIPTGDGTITALQVLDIMKKTGKSLSELKQIMKTVPQTIKNINVKEKKPFEQMSRVIGKIREAEKQLKDNGRIIVRYSGTENKARVMVEGRDEKQIKEIADNIANEIKKEVGE